MAQLPILGPFAVSFGTGAVYTGIILGSYSLVNMTGNLLAGPFIDSRDREITIVLGLAVAGLAVAGYAIVARPWQLLLVRLLHGAGGAILIPAVFAWAGDNSREGRVGRTMGHAGAAVALAAMLGPALGGVGGALLGPRSVFLLLGILLCAAALVFGLWYRHSRLTRPVHPALQSRPDAAAILAALRDRRLAAPYQAILGLTFVMGTLAYAIPLKVVEWGYSTAYTGVLFSLASIATILLLLLPTKALPDRIGTLPVTRIGLFLILIALITLFPARRPGALALGMGLYGLGFGAVFAATTTAVVLAAGRNRRGTAFGVYYAFFSLGVFIGPIAAGALRSAGWNPYWGALIVIIVTQAAGLRQNGKAPVENA